MEEVEQAKRRDLELSDQDQGTFKVALFGLRLAALSLSQRSQLYCRRLNARTSPSLPLRQYLTFFVFTLTDSELYTACGVYKSGALIIVLQVEYIQLEQVKYDRRQKHYVVIGDL